MEKQYERLGVLPPSSGGAGSAEKAAIIFVDSGVEDQD
jgi:hypothetical protein